MMNDGMDSGIGNERGADFSSKRIDGGNLNEYRQGQGACHDPNATALEGCSGLDEGGVMRVLISASEMSHCRS
jgi:hypothetical protein